jgi:hypothetical protein
MDRSLVLALSLAILVGGCTSPAALEKASKTKSSHETGPLYPTTSAAAPTVSSTNGSISGVVTDDERLPVYAAAVASLQINRETRTDANGAYTFNDVPPGDYNVVADKLGYKPTARKVHVEAGQVTHANFSLPKLAATTYVEPYTLAMPHTGYVLFGNAWFDVATYAANSTGLRESQCSSCTWHYVFDAVPQQMLSEARWACSPCVSPVLNDDTWYLAYVNDTGNGGTNILNTYLKNGVKYNWTEKQTSLMGHSKDHSGLWRINGGGGAALGAGGVSYNQRINHWQTFAYGKYLDEKYSAFPPS